MFINKMEDNEKNELTQLLLKKARGYFTTEVVTEFSGKENGFSETKRKETVKEVPPDLAAIKMLLDDGDDETDNLSLEELNAERNRLVKLLLAQEKAKKLEDKKKEIK